MKIRLENKGDYAAVHAVNVAAFETTAEAALVDALRQKASPLISLAAEAEEQIVGHIMFSPVTLSGHSDLVILGLAPMAVLPAYQRRGVGTALVLNGLDHCRATGAGAVVVLGHPRYYPRFGFVPSVDYHIDCEYDVPADTFMILELQKGYLQEAAGTIRYHEQFGRV